VTPLDSVQAWLAPALADAERRGLGQLKALLESLAASTAQLRQADWNDDAADSRPGSEPVR
jgi:hypothetical protein